MIAAIVFPLLVLVWLWLALWGVRLVNRGRSLAAQVLIGACLALALDALVIAIGRRSLEDVGWLVALNQARLWLRALVLSLLALAALEMARRGGVTWLQGRGARLGGWLAAGLLAALLILTETRGLQPACYGATLRYSLAVPANQVCGSADPTFAHWPAIPFVIALLCLALGVMLWQATRSPWLALGAAVLAVALLLPASLGPLPVAAAEVLLVASLLATERYLVRNLNLYDFKADE